jgi:superfamily II DNA/RNA helicase
MIDQYGGAEKRVLIFCEKKVQVDDLSKKLRVQNQPLHGDVAQNRRENAYRNFKAGSLKCIVATNVAARGLDFPQIDLIVQTMPPLNTEEFIHRAGRTGRAGRSGVNLLLFDRTRSHLVRKI